MRITNKMMTNNVLYNINGNKNAMSKLEQQYSTGMKIQRPSEDPIIATRALKLRTNLTELNQFYEKNIPDAMSWMELTEGALKETNDILSMIHTYCVNGANGTLTESDRNSLVTTLNEYKEQIYQEGNTNYAGRYVFSGYKTDKSLVFNEELKGYNYNIKEKTSGKDIDIIQVTKNPIGTDPTGYDPTDPKPNFISAYRLRLAYDKLKPVADHGDIRIEIPRRDASGKVEHGPDGKVIYDDRTGLVSSFSSTDEKAYNPGDDEVHYLADTGELILGKNVYEAWNHEEEIKVTYDKNSFVKNDLRPEHYFDCEVTNEADPTEAPITYTKQNQDICYEVNFNQKMIVNTQGSDAITHDIGRVIDDIIKSVNSVIEVGTKISDVKKQLSDTSVSAADKETLKEMLNVLNTEKTLKDKVLQNTFGRALTEVSGQQTTVNVAIADLGSRYSRLELTQNRLSAEQGDFEEILSNNEDADIVDTVIKLKSQEAVYNASLSAAAKIVKNSLLDFL